MKLLGFHGACEICSHEYWLPSSRFR
jgi:hypothetical protein